MGDPIAGEGPARALQRSGLAPRKRLGQNFLRDRNFLGPILEAVDLSAEDDVLEIGAGTGVLTLPLAERARRVVAVELDDSLAALLVKILANTPNVEVWQGNALDFDPCLAFRGGYKLVGNIPYYVTGPIIRRYLEATCQPRVLVLMVQWEVARRITATPGDLSLLGVSVQHYAHTKIVTRVPAGAFFPRPKVDSAIVRLTPRADKRSATDTRSFFAVARAGFGMRRKQLINSLSRGLDVTRGEAELLLGRAGIAPSRRAETLSLEEWHCLAARWTEYTLGGRR
jgi:16S rRNA (adenine1518-N6/adenine1519-N6)-dimethyltransferase